MAKIITTNVIVMNAKNLNKFLDQDVVDIIFELFLTQVIY